MPGTKPHHPIVQRALKEGHVTDLGQLTDEEKKALKAAVQNAALKKGKGGGFPVRKTVYAPASQHEQRSPKEHETRKRPFYMIVQYGRIYSCRNSDLSRNESSITWASSGDSEIAKPVPGRGCDPATSAREIQAFFNALPRDLVYAAFLVFEDSFPEFNRAKEMATTANLDYGWEPFRNQAGPVSFSSEGHKPKPQ